MLHGRRRSSGPEPVRVELLQMHWLELRQPNAADLGNGVHADVLAVALVGARPHRRLDDSQPVLEIVARRHPLVLYEGVLVGFAL
jgi:hypothetical protein